MWFLAQFLICYPQLIFLIFLCFECAKWLNSVLIVHYIWCLYCYCYFTVTVLFFFFLIYGSGGLLSLLDSFLIQKTPCVIGVNKTYHIPSFWKLNIVANSIHLYLIHVNLPCRPFTYMNQLCNLYYLLYFSETENNGGYNGCPL